MSGPQSTMDATRAGATQLADGVGDAVDHVGRQARTAMAHAEDIAASGLDHVETAVRRNPLASAAIAAGVGFFLAVVARR